MSDGRLFAGLTLYRGKPDAIVWKPLASVEVQFTEWEGNVTAFAWVGLGHRFWMFRLPDGRVTRRLREGIKNPGHP